jgi:tRNA/tmRNA/rRNA uracil-C5-methylase (TrmA/RlmC/RlmD family)
VYDLYTGTGTIAQFVSKKAKSNWCRKCSWCIKDAKANAVRNNIDNCEFYVGDMKLYLTMILLNMDMDISNDPEMECTKT